MTWHFFQSESVTCPSCGLEFIPFEPEQPCPQCGAPAPKHFDFVPEIVAGLRAHKSEYGSFTSGAYFIGSFAENVFHWTGLILDSAEQTNDVGGLDLAIAQRLDAIDWAEHESMKAYFQTLIPRVWEELEKKDADET